MVAETDLAVSDDYGAKVVPDLVGGILCVEHKHECTLHPANATAAMNKLNELVRWIYSRWAQVLEVMFESCFTTGVLNS